jgi:hypothetical protein
MVDRSFISPRLRVLFFDVIVLIFFSSKLLLFRFSSGEPPTDDVMLLEIRPDNKEWYDATDGMELVLLRLELLLLLLPLLLFGLDTTEADKSLVSLSALSEDFGRGGRGSSPFQPITEFSRLNVSFVIASLFDPTALS